jgi:FkbM family methyltransferase
MKLVGTWWLPDSEDFSFTLKVAQDDTWECRDVIGSALEYVQKFDRAIDIGAWVGDSTAFLAQQFQHVTAFEAHPDVFECCEKNLQTRDINNVELLQYAVSNRPGPVELFTGVSTISGWINTVEEPLGLHIDQCTVQARTLDSFGFADIDLIKIDVDSHEGFLLQGAENFFKQNSPVVILEHKLSVQIRQHKDSPDPFDILDSYGYKVVKSLRIDHVLIKK